MRKTVLLITLIFVVSCKSQKTLGDYGTSEFKLLHGNEKFISGKLDLIVGDYTLNLDLDKFKQELSKQNAQNEIENLINLATLKIVLNSGQAEINGRILNPINYYETNILLNKIIYNEQFYSNKNVSIEYKHWIPQFQGQEYAEWIIDNKVVNKVVLSNIE